MAVSLSTLILDYPFFWVFFTAYCLVYIFAYRVIFWNWSPKARPEASSCIISLVHGTPAAIMAVAAILAVPDNWGFAAPNTDFQCMVLEYSIAYFTTDLLHYVVFYSGDYLFIAHHLATLFVFVTCRFLVFHGAFAILVLLVLAEVTSACQNVWTLAGIQKDESPVAAKVYNYLSPPFYSLYTIARAFVGPLFFYKMSIFYISGKASSVIPLWVSLSWIIVVGGAISVSILWILNHWLELFRDEEKKKR
uniref:Transmembrane protein 136 n=1 Tax=Anthurium amnicola TaxID=1678845 RepID=A0A1D1Y2Q4_9ARAE